MSIETTIDLGNGGILKSRPAKWFVQRLGDRSPGTRLCGGCCAADPAPALTSSTQVEYRERFFATARYQAVISNASRPTEKEILTAG